MTKIKFCGIRRIEDIEYVNELKPDYIGFVFWEHSKRAIDSEVAKKLKDRLDPNIKAVGVFVDEAPEAVAELCNQGVIDIAQLHGSEDEAYIAALRKLTDAPIIKAFKIKTADNIEAARVSTADMVLLDSGYGTGKVFDWNLFSSLGRPFFLAGGISAENLLEAIDRFKPYAVDLSSAIETDGFKDKAKMETILRILRDQT